MLLTTSLFLTTSYILHCLTTLHAPHPLFSRLSTLHSRLYSLLSLLLLLLILSPSSLTPTPLTPTLYHVSKFYEYIDILLVILSGGHVNLHFGFHHTTTPWLTYVRVLPPDGEGSEGWKWFGVVNTAHHVGMYAYFGGWVRGEMGRRVLEVTGVAQLVVGIMVDGVVAWGRWMRGEETWRMGVSAGLLGAYLGLTWRERRGKRAERAREMEQEELDVGEGAGESKGE